VVLVEELVLVLVLLDKVVVEHLEGLGAVQVLPEEIHWLAVLAEVL
jgi:hypothetical protein